MISPRWKKLLRDLLAAQGRMIMMIIAIATSIFGVGTMLSAYTIMTREISRNYLGTNPASAFIELDQVDNTLVEAVRQQPGIADAEAGDWVTARVEVNPNEWMPLLLFVIPDFDKSRISTVRHEVGAWSPPEHTILVEREVLPLIDVKLGDTLTVQTPNGEKQPVRISGVVHDPSLAPAWQEQTIYGYITPATLAWLGETDILHLLKITVSDQPTNLAAIEATTTKLANWLKSQGRTIEEIRIPPPEQHPHQGQLNTVMMILLVFSLLSLLLSAILTATMIGNLLAQQIRQIGIMKAIGARSGQIANMYLALIAVLGAIATIIGIPLGIAAGRGFSTVVARLLNFTIYSNDVPVWVYVMLLLMGTFIPLLVAIYPIFRATRTTVRETINDYGTNLEAFGTRTVEGWLRRLRGLDNTLLLSLRNTFRRQGRLLLTIILLAAAGAMFITGINTQLGWETYLTNAAADRHYDLEIRLNKPYPEQQIVSTLANLPNVKQVEAWNSAPAALNRENGLNIVRTYPDGGHGSFTLRSAPPASQFVATPVLDGRWLREADLHGVVLNQSAKASMPNVQLGDDIQLLIDGKTVSLQLVGVIRQVLVPATAYVTPQTFADVSGQPVQLTNTVRVAMTSRDAAAVIDTTRAIEQKLTEAGISVKVAVSEALLDDATSGHVLIFIVALLLIAAVMATVGILGLMSSMGTNVIERTREFGILRTIGGTSSAILRIVIGEGSIIAVLSWIIAVPLAIPVTSALGTYLGNMSFRSPLPLTVSLAGIVVWLLLIIVGAFVASVFPARQASRLTIRETLAYL